MLPGDGDATFGSPRLVHASASFFPPGAAVGRFGANDSVPDIVVIDSEPQAADHTAFVYPGRGDFTFDTAVETHGIVSDVQRARVVDLDLDGTADVVGISEFFTSVVMLRNTGDMTFTIREYPLGTELGDVRAADLNGDSTVDVVVAMSWREPVSPGSERRGDVAVLLDGFEAVDHQVYDVGVPGEASLALGDFTGDGQIDIATGNLSYEVHEDEGIQLWSSVSILKGTIVNPATREITFGSPVTFPLGTVNGEGYQESWTLDAADFNRDGRLDLAHAPGALLLNEVPVENRPPTVFAGPDRTIVYDPGPGSEFIKGEASDPDGHWLHYRWSNGGTAPFFLAPDHEPGVYTFTLTVDDGQGGTASDTVTITVPDHDFLVVSTNVDPVVTVGAPYTIEWSATELAGPLRLFNVSYSTDGGRNFTAIPECSNLPPTARSCIWLNPGPASERALLRIEAHYGSSDIWVFVTPEFRLGTGAAPLPAGWQSRDIGAVGAPGRAVLRSGFISVLGSGADIWGTSDEFHYAYTTVTGDFDIVAHVTNVEAVRQWTKGGLIVRRSLAPDAAHVSLFATSSSFSTGTSLQSRAEDGGTSAEHARVPVREPVWLRLIRRGNLVLAAYRQSNTAPWTALPLVTAALGATVQVGLAVTSHADGTLATATFEDVTITRWNALPTGATSGDVGDVGAPGNASFDGNVFTVTGSGADIWGTSDEFHWVFTPVSGNFEMVARVLLVEPVHEWTKAGLVIRETPAPDSRHASIFVTPAGGHGIAFQRRTVTGRPSTHTAGPDIAARVWLRLVRNGDSITASYRVAASDAWVPIGTETLVGLPETISIGLAVTSHADGTLATATFDRVRISAAAGANVSAAFAGPPAP